MSADDAHDAFQQSVAALFALPRHRRPSNARDLGRWLRVAAFRTAEKERRRRSRYVIEFGDRPAPSEVVSTVEERALLREIVSEIRSMPEHLRAPLIELLARDEAAVERVEAAAELQRLVDEFGELPASTQPRPRNRMRLVRARAELRRRTSGWLATLPGLPRVRPPLHRRQMQATAGAGLCAVGAMLVSLPLTHRDVASPTIEVHGGSIAPIDIATVRQMPAPSSTKPPPTPPTRSSHDVLDDERRPPTTDPIAPVLVRVANHDRPPGDTTFVCVRNVRGLHDQCIHHPLLERFPDGPTPPLP